MLRLAHNHFGTAKRTIWREMVALAFYRRRDFSRCLNTSNKLQYTFAVDQFDWLSYRERDCI